MKKVSVIAWIVVLVAVTAAGQEKPRVAEGFIAALVSRSARSGLFLVT